jgi:hypothetical protein
MSVARFMIDRMERFQEFRGRDLNAHMPTLDAHRRMLLVFEPILMGGGAFGGELSLESMIAIVREQVHPENRGKAA